MQVNYNPNSYKWYSLNPESEITRLIMLSGGMDSCAALIKELKETNNQVHVHHVIIESSDNRHDLECKAVKHIVDYCRKNYRPFVFTSSKFSWPNIGQINFIPKDSFTVNFVAGGIALSIHQAMLLESGKCKPIEVVIAMTSTELFPETYESYLKHPAYSGFEMALNCFFYNYESEKKPIPKIILPFVNTTKYQVSQIVPDELKPFIVSCRYPQVVNDDFVDCGYCHTCRLIQKYKE